MEDHVILVDANDVEIGVECKMAAHRSGKLHRAISIFVFDSGNRLLLQKRTSTKYHSGGLWSNTCCSHPRPDEDNVAAASRRLREEMGIECDLSKVFSFVYRTEFANGLTEHEYDHVFFGSHDGAPVPNPEEAEDWKWMGIAELSADVKSNPSAYSSWLAVCLDRVVSCRDSRTLRLLREETCPGSESVNSLR